MSPIITAVLPVAIELIGRFIPDPEQKAKLQLAVMRMDQAGQFKELEADLQSRLAQLRINEVEAGSDDKFKSWWRPAFGWMGVFVIGTEMIVRPFLPWLMEVFGFYVPPIPSTDTELFWTLIFGLLGIGGMRSIDKRKGLK